MTPSTSQNLKLYGGAMCVIVLAIATTLLLANCTEQQRAKSYGGNANVDLPNGQKLTCVTWEEDHLWYLYRPMHADEKPETSVLQEQSSFGVFQGTVTFHEH